jgi:alpha-glucuronidase
MKNWSNLWLNNNDCYFSVALEGFDKEHPLVKNAWQELAGGDEAGAGLSLRVMRVAESGLGSEGYCLREGGGVLTLEAEGESGVLYGVFHILRLLAMKKPLPGYNARCVPDNRLRMLNHWDNMDGSIERGYSG